MAARNGGVVQRSLERTEYIQNTAEPQKLEQTREQKVGAVKQGQIGKGGRGGNKTTNGGKKRGEKRLHHHLPPTQIFTAGTFL